MTLELKLIILSLVICLLLIVFVTRKKILLHRENAETIGGSMDKKEKNIILTTVLIGLIVMGCLLIVLASRNVGIVEVSQTQTVNINTLVPEIEESTNDLLDINTASAKELITLDGIGTTKANRIIEYRENKSFERVTELLNVVGEVTFDNIKDHIKIGGE